ncbi:MAG TPA: signal peptidase I [Thermoanaerobaculia bacterium]|nr:signal peptidase I [Thermoanaerobaculia bacterium]
MFEVVLVAVVAALFVRTFLFQAFVVPSGSMEPTVLPGDHLLVNKFIFAPHGRALAAILPYRGIRRGDVLVFKFPKDPAQDFIKRVVALPADLVVVRGKQVLVNGAPETRSVTESPPVGGEPAPLEVPADAYFALGDNRASSYDSRFWGPVPAANIKGRALEVYWSIASPAKTSRNPLALLADFLRRTRWKRSFQLVR